MHVILLPTGTQLVMSTNSSIGCDRGNRTPRGASVHAHIEYRLVGNEVLANSCDLTRFSDPLSSRKFDLMNFHPTNPTLELVRRSII